MASATQVKRVLIAEDYPDILQSLLATLCSAGVECDGAKDGREAKDYYDNAREGGRPYSVLVLDAAMPYLTGYEVTNYVREECKDAVPIIIITADSEHLVRPHAQYVKATEVLFKPFSPDELRAKVRERLNGRVEQRE